MFGSPRRADGKAAVACAHVTVPLLVLLTLGCSAPGFTHQYAAPGNTGASQCEPGRLWRGDVYDENDLVPAHGRLLGEASDTACHDLASGSSIGPGTQGGLRVWKIPGIHPAIAIVSENPQRGELVHHALYISPDASDDQVAVSRDRARAGRAR